jgi:uncharacterized membrane protein YecN with MAPEG domain
MTIVSLYAALLALLFVYLSVRTARMRKNLRVAVGDGGNTLMLRATRVHANFAEYVPLSLVLIFFVETGAAQAWFVHGLGATLLAGRALHAWGVSKEREKLMFRVAGMLMTMLVMIAAAVFILYKQAQHAGV